jgi:hypothetical protein
MSRACVNRCKRRHRDAWVAVSAGQALRHVRRRMTAALRRSAGRTAELAGRQTAVVSQVQEAVAAQSKALSAAAGTILNDKPVEASRFVPLSSAEAILRYAGDFPELGGGHLDRPHAGGAGHHPVCGA